MLLLLLLLLLLLGYLVSVWHQMHKRLRLRLWLRL
jgi:hypothetical protein